MYEWYLICKDKFTSSIIILLQCISGILVFICIPGLIIHHFLKDKFLEIITPILEVDKIKTIYQIAFISILLITFLLGLVLIFKLIIICFNFFFNCNDNKIDDFYEKFLSDFSESDKDEEKNKKELNKLIKAYIHKYYKGQQKWSVIHHTSLYSSIVISGIIAIIPYTSLSDNGNDYYYKL